MQKWKEYKLNEVTEPVKETYNPDGSSDFAYIGLEHIEQGTLRLNSIGVSSDVTSNKFKFQPNDILFGKLRPYFRKVVKPQFNGICSTDIWVFRAKKDFNQNFLYYFLASWEFVNTANGAETGTRMPRADWSFLKDTEWSFPPLPEQAAIAEILSSLDDKIDLLHRQNKTLEQLAETLFREWFVEEAEESWEEIPIGSVLITVLGGTPSTQKPEYWNGKIPWINSGEINEFRISKATAYITELGLKKSSAKLMPAGTTVLAITGATLGQVSILEIEACANQSVIGIIPNETFPTEFIFLWINLKIKEIISRQTGGAQQHINKNDVNETLIVKPPKELMKSKMPIFSDYFNKISANIKQINSLVQLRDSLLPKLMSGEVRVKE